MSVHAAKMSMYPMIVSHINNFITTWSQSGFSALKSSQSLHNRSIAYLVLKIVLNTQISVLSIYGFSTI